MKYKQKRYGILFRISFVFIILSIFHSTSPIEAKPLACVEEIVHYALSRQLFNDKYWWTLLHYKKTLSGLKSLVDDPDFFISPKGKGNPQAELEASIRAFFGPDPHEAKKYISKFIARYSWLKHKLEAASFSLPDVACNQFNEFIKKINPTSAILAFPTSHMNSPASMFGHTLLIVNTDYKSKLVSYAINYSASANDRNGFLFAFKGIFGFYEGYFSILPYYEKLTEYNDMDQRDIWEYHLNLTREEIIRMLMTLWEMENIHSNYYFFDENCSYTLLFLLDAARPSLTLTDQFKWWVMPIDTIRAVKENGLVKNVSCRVSKASKIKHMASFLDEKNKNLALDVLGKTISPNEIIDINLPVSEKIKIIDIVTENLQYRYARKDISKKQYLDLFLPTLHSRSQLGKGKENQHIVSSQIQPKEGHKSNRTNIGCGIREGDLFQEIKIRPAYHNLMDNDNGYLAGSQIEFCDISLRYYSDAKDVQLDSLDVINIISLSARDKFFHPISWKVRVGITEGKLMPDENTKFLYEFEGGGGFAYKNTLLGLYYILGEAEMNFGNGIKKNHSIGFGGTIGMLKNITDFWKLSLYSRDLYYALGDRYSLFSLHIRQGFTLTRNNSIAIEVSGKKVSDSYQREGKINWNYFF